MDWHLSIVVLNRRKPPSPRKDDPMKTLIASLTCTLLLLATTSRADKPVPTPPVPQVTVTPLPSPPQPHHEAAHHSEHQLSKVEHLRRAAEQLEAAGEEQLAREVRQLADELQEASVEQLNQKREQVARLQREIAELEEVTGCSQQIMLKCRVIDVDIAKARQLHLSLSVAGAGDSDLFGAFCSSPNDAAIMEGLIDALVHEDLARVLAEPVLITTNGRPATLRSGGEFPIPLPAGPGEAKIAWRNCGLTLEAVPVVLGDGRVRLEIAPELTTRDFENAVTLDGIVVPGLQTRRANTQVELEFGETATLVMPAPGAVEKVRQASAEDGGDGEQTVTIFCVTPERVSPMSAHPVPDPQPMPTY
jgi:Bacterial type II and III secretion system protein